MSIPRAPLTNALCCRFSWLVQCSGVGGGWWRGQFEIALPALPFRRQQSSCFKLLQYMRESWLNLTNVGCTPLLAAWSWLILGAHTRQADIEPWFDNECVRTVLVPFWLQTKASIAERIGWQMTQKLHAPMAMDLQQNRSGEMLISCKVGPEKMCTLSWLESKCIKIRECLDDCQSFTTCFQGMQYGKIIFQHISRRCLFQCASWWSCGSPCSDSLCAYIYVDVSWCAWLGL